MCVHVILHESGQKQLALSVHQKRGEGCEGNTQQRLRTAVQPQITGPKGPQAAQPSFYFFSVHVATCVHEKRTSCTQGKAESRAQRCGPAQWILSQTVGFIAGAKALLRIWACALQQDAPLHNGLLHRSPRVSRNHLRNVRQNEVPRLQRRNRYRCCGAAAAAAPGA